MSEGGGRIGWIFVGLVFLAGGFVVCLPILHVIFSIFAYRDHDLYPVYTHRYRLTLNVQVDGQVHSGSGVFEVAEHPGPEYLEGMNSGGEMPYARGEAIFVDLGKRGALIMTLRQGKGNWEPDGMALAIFGRYDPDSRQEVVAQLKRLSSLQATATVSPDRLWSMVTFRDLNDPKSLREVDPENLSATFGPGVTLLPAIIEMTHDPVTTGLEKHLPWLDRPGQTFFLSGQQSTIPGELNYGLSDFRSGVK